MDGWKEGENPYVWAEEADPFNSGMSCRNEAFPVNNQVQYWLLAQLQAILRSK